MDGQMRAQLKLIIELIERALRQITPSSGEADWLQVRPYVQWRKPRSENAAKEFVVCTGGGGGEHLERVSIQL